MTGSAVTRASAATNLTRYGRSWGLWFLLLTAVVGARFMVARDNGQGIQIAMGKHLPVISSAVLGVSLGIVVSTLLLPVGFIYLRSNVTREQPWQIDEVTAASRVAIALGRFAADVAVLFGMLAALTLAGWFLSLFIVHGKIDLVQIGGLLWLIAAPALVGLAAVHRLLDAIPFTRRALGEVVFFILWVTAIAMPVAVTNEPSSFAVNLADFAGFVRPLTGPKPSAGQDFTIGSTGGLLPGRVPLDVMPGVKAPGYIASRIAWVVISLALAIVAGLVFGPHRARRPRRLAIAIDRLLAPGAPPPVVADAQAAPLIGAPLLGLAVGEFRLIGAGRLFKLLAVGAAVVGLFGDYRHIGSPAALLLLVFGLVAHAGRSEAKGLLPLTDTAPLGPWVRRAAFVVGGLAWSVLLAAPAALVRLSIHPLLLTGGWGLAAAVLATALATVSRGAFAPRLVLLILWYAYLSA